MTEPAEVQNAMGATSTAPAGSTFVSSARFWKGALWHFGAPSSLGRHLTSRPPLRKGGGQLRPRGGELVLMGAAEADLHRLDQRGLHGRVGEQRERVLGDRAVMAGAPHRVLERAVAGHVADRGLEVALLGVALLEGAAPERALAVGAA